LANHATAAAAAKINAQLQARKGIQHVDVPPVRSSSAGGKDGGAAAHANVNGEMYVADGDFIKDIEVNDLRNRYILTKGSTQKMVNELLVVVTTDPPPAPLPQAMLAWLGLWLCFTLYLIKNRLLRGQSCLHEA